MSLSKLFLLLSLLIILFLIYQISPISLSSEEVRFVVPLAEKKEETIRRLKAENLIRNEKIFDILMTVFDFPEFREWQIEPGAYNLQKNFWLPKTANILLFHPYQKWVLLTPGLRKEQIAEILAEKFDWDILKEKEFLDSSEEGYLYPDTYLLNVDYSPKETAQKLKSNFNEKFDAKLQNDLLSQNVRNDTAIKIASLIERESGSLEDKALISAIIWNRLKIDMRLQIDATTQYIIGTRGNWWPRVRPEDHKITSLYNTYLHKGLPPTPIANPSLDSINAAVYPAETECLFYLHDSSKTIHCSETYDGHLQNIEKYLK